jgi:RNA polymerase sporulation-specific sigma factor
MSEAHKMGLDELFAIGEIEAFYQVAKEKAEKKIGSTKVAGMDREDVVQEALIKVHRYLPKYDPSKAKISTWVEHIIGNMIRDMLSKAGTEKNLNVVNATSLNAYQTDTDNAYSGAVSSSPQIGVEDYGYENAEVMIDLMEHVNLTDREKSIVRLRSAGYSPNEMAVLLKLSPSRISQLWKGITAKYNTID